MGSGEEQKAAGEAPEREIEIEAEALLCEAPSCAHLADTPRAASVPVASLYVSGKPRPKQSGRMVRGAFGRSRFVSQATADKGIKLYRERLTRRAREVMDMMGGPENVAEWTKARGGTAGLWLIVRWTFETPRRERWGEPHTAKPDADNLSKLLLDALSDGGWFTGWRNDDAAGARLSLEKTWGQTSGVGVEMRALVPGSREKREAPSCAYGEPPAWLADDGVPAWVLAGAGEGVVIDPLGDLVPDGDGTD